MHAEIDATARLVASRIQLVNKKYRPETKSDDKESIRQALLLLVFNML